MVYIFGWNLSVSTDGILYILQWLHSKINTQSYNSLKKTRIRICDLQFFLNVYMYVRWCTIKTHFIFFFQTAYFFRSALPQACDLSVMKILKNVTKTMNSHCGKHFTKNGAKYKQCVVWPGVISEWYYLDHVIGLLLIFKNINLLD